MNARLVAAFFGSALSILGGISFANSNNTKPTVARSFVEHNKSYLLTGPITPSTVREARMVFSTIDSSSFGPQVYLDSPGGDVNSAIEIGRLLRSKRATAHVLECASACVLVFAGASNRTRIRFKRTGNGYDVMDVIIHRPYFASAAANPNQAETQSRFSALRSAVRDYLLEMNVSPALWDAMVGISPSDARALTEQEFIDYGLVDTDPVEEEIVRQETSNRWQIPPQEVLRRESLGEKICYSGVLSIFDSTPSSCAAYFDMGGVDLGKTPIEYAERAYRISTFCTSQAREASMDLAESKKDFTLLRKLLKIDELCQQRQALKTQWRILFDVD